jgi:hypothetical protein
MSLTFISETKFWIGLRNFKPAFDQKPLLSFPAIHVIPDTHIAHYNPFSFISMASILTFTTITP